MYIFTTQIQVKCVERFIGLSYTVYTCNQDARWKYPSQSRADGVLVTSKKLD